MRALGRRINPEGFLANAHGLGLGGVHGLPLERESPRQSHFFQRNGVARVGRQVFLGGKLHGGVVNPAPHASHGRGHAHAVHNAAFLPGRGRGALARPVRAVFLFAAGFIHLKSYGKPFAAQPVVLLRIAGRGHPVGRPGQSRSGLQKNGQNYEQETQWRCRHDSSAVR